MSRTLLLVAIAVAMTGCATLQHVSSGQTGCSPEEIAISNDQGGWGTRTWTAECRGQVYQCSAHGGGSHSTAQVSCTPKPNAATAREAPAEAGCSYDTQCKGDRVCVKGACVDPESKTAVVPARGSEPARSAPPPQ
jgi:hypothetical protein